MPNPPKILPEGKAYACPKCGEPMLPYPGPYDVLYCNNTDSHRHYTVDLWWDPTPKIINT